MWVRHPVIALSDEPLAGNRHDPVDHGQPSACAERSRLREDYDLTDLDAAERHVMNDDKVAYLEGGDHALAHDHVHGGRAQSVPHDELRPKHDDDDDKDVRERPARILGKLQGPS